jgi:hypothetical protein
MARSDVTGRVWILTAFGVGDASSPEGKHGGTTAGEYVTLPRYLILLLQPGSVEYLTKAA